LIEFKYLGDEEVQRIIQNKAPPYPAVKFVVFSDPHLYNPSLGTTGEEFEKHMHAQMRLINYSEDILKAVNEIIINSDSDFVIITGDLTKDGNMRAIYFLLNILLR